MHNNAKVFIFDLFRPVLNNTNGKSISSFSLYTTYTSYDTYVNMTGWLAIYCNAATHRSRFYQKAAWMVSQASGSQVWRDLIAVLIAGSYSDDQWSSQLLRGGYKAPMPPQGRCWITYFTANLCGPVGQTVAWVLVGKFLPSSATQRRFRSWSADGHSVRH